MKMRVLSLNRSWHALAACSLGAAFVISSHAATAQRPQNTAPADHIIVNGAVYPGGGRNLQQAVAVRGNRIAAVGTNEEIGALRGPKISLRYPIGASSSRAQASDRRWPC